MAIALGLKLRVGALTALISGVITTSLEAWHKFTASTWTGSNRLPDSSTGGTNTAALYTGRGLSFDGVNDVVTVGATGVTVKTVVFYAYPDTTTQAFMQLQSTGAVRIEISSGTLSATGFTSPTLYVNGAASSTVAATTWQQIAITSATGISASNVLFGQSNTTYYSGDLSNVKFFSTELNSAQIAELYANPEQALPTGAVAADLIGWWPISSGTNASFLINNLQGAKKWGTISGATWLSAVQSPVLQTALIGQSKKIVLNGTSQYLSKTVADFRSSDNVGSLSAWIYIPSNPAADSTIFMSGDTATSGSHYLLFYVNNTGKARFQVKAAGSTLITVSTTNSVVGGWYHVVYTSNGSTIKIYVNGTLETLTLVSGSNAGQWFNDVSNRDNIAVGAYRTSITDLYFGGMIDELAIYSVELSQSEITSLYGGTLASSVQSSNLVSYWVNNSATTWTDLGSGSNNLAATGSPSQIILIPSTSGTDFIGRALDSQNSGYFLANAQEYASIADTSSLDITTVITLEAWIKPFTVSSTQTIIGKNSAYALNVTSGAKLQFQRWSSSSSGTVSSSASITANTWTHVAATYDGTNTKIYINGALDTNSTSISGAIDSTATNVLMGALTASTQLFNGYIDSAKIYSDDLSAANVLNNYTTEAPDYA